MWYKKSSIDNIINKFSDELICSRIKRAYMMQKNNYPTQFELKKLLNIVKKNIEKKYHSIISIREEEMERNILKIVDKVIDENPHLL